MQIDRADFVFELSDVELETLRRAALERDLPFDEQRREYGASELETYGLVREAYNPAELKSFGVSRNKVVTSFDVETARARDALRVDAPFASKIRKWQLPIDICEWRVFVAEFPPGTFVEPHVHPANTIDQPGGSLRTVLKGSISYAGRSFGPGDWFYIPNGVPYSFETHAKTETIVEYKYAFFGVVEGNRFSHPMEIERYRQSHETAA
jgi:hypothetical protein